MKLNTHFQTNKLYSCSIHGQDGLCAVRPDTTVVSEDLGAAVERMLSDQLQILQFSFHLRQLTSKALWRQTVGMDQSSVA